MNLHDALLYVVIPVSVHRVGATRLEKVLDSGHTFRDSWQKNVGILCYRLVSGAQFRVMLDDPICNFGSVV